MADLKNFYISQKNSRSGISKYSNDFYSLILRERDFIFLDSAQNIKIILSKVSSKDHVHIEIGIFQKKEIEILMAMLDANYTNVAATFHDPPLFKYPFFSFQNSFVNKVSKFYDMYINGFRKSGKYLRKIKVIYVLTQKGLLKLKSTYNIDNVYFLPHIVDEREIKRSESGNKNFFYFGFIGKNKGIEYSLLLHENLLKHFPEMHFYVIGEAIGKEKKYYDFLKKTYTRNVHYLGYVPEDELEEVFDKCAFSMMLFKDYKFYCPFSGSLLMGMKYGKIPFTNDVNAIREMIEDKRNGFYLSGNINEDLTTITESINNTNLLGEVKKEILTYLLAKHTAQEVSRFLID